MLIILISISILFISIYPKMQIDGHSALASIFIALIFLLLFAMMALMSMQLLFFPKAVEINSTEQALTIHYFTLPSKTIYPNEISEYTTTVLHTRTTDYEGVLVHSKTGRKYLFDDISITDYKPVKYFLEDSKISLAGKEKFNNLSYFILFFKFR